MILTSEIQSQESTNFKTNILDTNTINKLIEIFKSTYDPEIPINIYDLGLIYEVNIINDVMNIKLNLTAIGCPYYNKILNELKEKIKQILHITNINIEFIYDPPWNPGRMTKEGREMYKAIYGYDPYEIWAREQKEFEEEQKELEEF